MDENHCQEIRDKVESIYRLQTHSPKFGMKKHILTILALSAFLSIARADELDKLLPVRGFCIEAPRANGLNEFIAFVNDELAPRHVNTLILRVDYNYQYESHPEVRDGTGLSKADVKKLVEVCHTNHIRLIPQINLLGHQSWAKTTFGLLRSHPEFDETPQVKTENYTNWPNSDGLYCKSYCPLHPELHAIVFDLIDEVCDTFESDAFHAGMDEVFYIGHDKCPRCSGRDKAELFAGEVRTLRDHLAQKNRQLWIWGDRLIDGKTTGIGEWEASYNNTHRAIDMVPKDIMICDWHYDRPDQTPVYFAMKGLNVITCPWRNPKIAVLQTQDMVKFRDRATKEMKPRYQGMMQTVWSGAGGFLENDYKGNGTNANNPWTTFKAMSDEWEKLKNSQTENKQKETK
jgi:hypothetical protein